MGGLYNRITEQELRQNVRDKINNAATKDELQKAINNITPAVDKDTAVNNIAIQGNIVPTANGTQTIGTPEQRFSAMYVNEVYLSTNTLYLGDTPVVGTDQDTVMIKADKDQSVNVKTIGTGQTLVTSENGVEVSASGMNADVKIQATGVGSRAVLSANSEVIVNTPKTTVNSDMTVNSLTVNSDLNVKGTNFKIDSGNITLKDNLIEINSGQVGTGVSAQYAGIKIMRGDLDPFYIAFDELDDSLKAGLMSSLRKLATEESVANVTGQTSNLQTTAKTNLVDAVNEIEQRIKNYNYVHNQIASSNVWTILHNLKRYPSVSIVDSGGNVVIGDVKYDSDTQLTISFASEFSGKAYLN